ncbi:MAG: HEAT repeat domain-containing protein [Chlamydiales bacterium]|nr:HEAT repeat domain-containing protein [Chlamydiales bacterium]
MINFLLPLLALMPIEDVRTIDAHLLVGDEKSAIVQARRSFSEHEDDPVAYEMLLKSLSAGKKDSEMIKLWYQFAELFPEEAKKQDVLEQMCWGVLRKGRESGQNTTRLLSLIGAALTQDMYAVDFLLSGMRSSNVQIRAIAVQLSSLFKDHVLKEEIIRLLDEEKNADVRVEVIKALGEIKEESVLPELIELVGSKRSAAIEKREAIKSILRIADSVDQDELLALAESKRAPLRLLACECIARFQLKEYGELLAVLMHDSHPEVAASAIHAVGLLKIEQLRGRPSAFYLGRLAKARDPIIGITASWALLLQNEEIGREALAQWLVHENAQAAATAAASVAAAGVYGLDLAEEYIVKAEDPYVQANLALALLGQREACDKACTVLANVLGKQKERWMVDEGIFSTIRRSTLTHKPEIPNYPEVINQTTRLELLNLLAILEYEDAHEAIKQFLKERRWGVTGLAAERLLGEGDESALDHMRELLQDPDREVRLEAALALATWGKDQSALPTLMQEYEEADRMIQIKILESLGRIGSKEAIPFLLERLKESSLNMRIIAASVLLQTIKN